MLLFLSCLTIIHFNKANGILLLRWIIEITTLQDKKYLASYRAYPSHLCSFFIVTNHVDVYLSIWVWKSYKIQPRTCSNPVRWISLIIHGAIRSNVFCTISGQLLIQVIKQSSITFLFTSGDSLLTWRVHLIKNPWSNGFQSTVYWLSWYHTYDQEYCVNLWR